jgi:PAS domain S-box-containing protein
MRQWACVQEANGALSSASDGACDRNLPFRQELLFYEEHTGDAFIGCSPAGAVAAWNPGAERIYGYSAREAIGRALSFLAAPSHIDEMARTLERVLQGTSVSGYEMVQKRKDGSPIQVALSLSPVYGARRKVVRISVVGRDLTAFRRCRDAARSALDQYHQLLEDVPCGILYMDPLGKVFYANRALIRMLCYSSARELHQIDAKSRLFPNARTFADFIAQETPFGRSSGIQMHWYRADRTSIRVRLNSRVITNDRKDLIAYEVFVEDVSS